jgi:hypothetical protein
MQDVVSPAETRSAASGVHVRLSCAFSPRSLGSPQPGAALYPFVLSHVDVEGRLLPAGSTLPDEQPPNPSEPSWAPGALEGAFGHAGDGAGDEERAARVADLVRWACARPSARRRRVLYEQVREDAVLEIADPLAQRLSAHPPAPQAVRELGCWLAMTAPDRGAVKVGLVLLGVAGVGEALPVVRVLGAHEELTLYAAVAVGNGTDDPEAELWAMARKVEGWGRIHCVERLQHTTDPAIRDWILRTGFRNSVMDDYLALIAARTGGLLPALRGPHVDRELLTAAGDILQALLPGGPAGDIDDYEDGAEAVEAYLEAMRTRATDLADLAAVTALQEWLASDTWTEPPGWSALQRELCLAACREITARDHWLDWISVALLSEDEAEFAQAQHLAVTRGQDTFDALLPRIWKDPFEGPVVRSLARGRPAPRGTPLRGGPGPAPAGADRVRACRRAPRRSGPTSARRAGVDVAGPAGLLRGRRRSAARRTAEPDHPQPRHGPQGAPELAPPGVAGSAPDLVQALATHDPHERTREYANRVLPEEDD